MSNVDIENYENEIIKLEKENIEFGIFRNKYFFSAILVHYFSLFMDVYTLGRIFKIFTNDQIANKIIIYTGVNHSNRYEKFLTKIGFNNIYKKTTTNTTDLCLNVSDLNYPIF